MNNVDKQYLDLLQDILDNGTYKKTRAGYVKSVFGRQMRFSMKDGLPILTTKKVFTKGVIHELLWFLKGDTNINQPERGPLVAFPNSTAIIENAYYVSDNTYTSSLQTKATALTLTDAQWQKDVLHLYRQGR